MTPDSAEWWWSQAQQAREEVRNDLTPENCCVYAMTLGRCVLFGKELSDSVTFSAKKALMATDVLVDMADDLKDKLEDIPWLVKIIPEDISDATVRFLNRRLDILSIQLILDCALLDVPSRYSQSAEDASDRIVNSLVDLDRLLTETLPLMRKHGNANKVLGYYRKRIVREFHDIWWLEPATRKRKSKKEKPDE